MKCVNDGNYTNATVVGSHGGKVPLCDDCVGTEPDAVYRTPTEIRFSQPQVSTGRPVGRPRGENYVPRAKGKISASAVTPTSTEIFPEMPTRPATTIHLGNGLTISAAPVVLILPAPPSANRWWRKHGTTMHLSKEAKAYKELVAVTARVHPSLIKGAPAIVAFPEQPLSVVIVWRRDRKAGDLDKRLGVLLDALQGVIYANDSQIVQIWARRCDEHPELQPGTVRVEVSPA